MTFVDEVRSTFDASEFCHIVTSGVGEGRASSEKALQDTNAATAALAALRNFHEKANSANPPDVVAAYVEYSPGAPELFNALRAVSTHKPIAEVALDSLTAVVRYSLEPKNPVQALERTRSIVKDVVRGGAVLVFNVFIEDSRSCAKKALNLLRLVAQCHPVLAKEIVNRFNLGADVMAPSLCSESNNMCRMPFLDLLFVLLASGDHDIARAFSTRARDILICCLKVIKFRTLRESNPSHPDVVAKEKQNSFKHGKNAKWNGKFVKKQGKTESIMPSHVQKRELVAAINLILAIERHIFLSSNKGSRRAAFAFPMMDILASIAAADMPLLAVVPRQVFPEHEALRAIASSLFLKVASDSQIANTHDIVSALNKTTMLNSEPAISFILRVIEEQPLVCSKLLESGPLLSATPVLSSKWFGYAAIVCACVPRLRAPVTRFLERQFFEKCLSHKDGLVREMGALILGTFCKVVQSDESAASEPQKYLPSVNHFQQLLKENSSSFRASDKLLSSYQQLFEGNAEESRIDLRKLSFDVTNDSAGASEESIRSALLADPGGTVRTAFSKRYFSALVISAAEAKERKTSDRCWNLSRDILACSGLFPPGTAVEIDVYLAILSSMGSEVRTCAQELEKVLDKAHQEPYGLFDELQRVTLPQSSKLCKTSLMSIAAYFRLKKLRSVASSPASQRSNTIFINMLSLALTTIAAVYQLLGSAGCILWFKELLSTVLHGNEVWWYKNSEALDNDDDIVLCCRAIQRFSLCSSSYLSTSFTELLRALSLHYLVGSSLSHRKNLPTFDSLVDGTVWKASSDVYFKNTRNSSLLPVYANAPCIGSDKRSEMCGFILKGVCDKADGTTILTSMKRLKTMSAEEDVAIAVGILLRATRDRRSLGIATRTALDILAQPHLEQHESLTSFIHESILRASIGRQSWMDDKDVAMLISFATYGLMKAGTKHFGSSHVTFSVRLLAKLCTHAEFRIRLRARRHLLYASDTDFLDFEVLSDAAWDLRTLLMYYPALESYIVREIGQWESSEYSRFTLQVLPVLQHLLSVSRHSPTAIRESLSVSAVCMGILDALIVSDSTKLPSWTGTVGTSLIDALGNLGVIMTLSKQSLECLVSFVMQSFGKPEGHQIALSWFLIQGVFKSESKGLLSSVLSDLDLLSLVLYMLKWFSITQIDLSKDDHLAAVGVFSDIMVCLRKRRVDVYGLSKDPTALEKGLTALCSTILKAIHAAVDSGVVHNENVVGIESVQMQGRKSQFGNHRGMSCVREILMLDLLLDKAAMRTIVSLSAHDGRILLTEAQNDHIASYEHHDYQDIPFSAVSTLEAALVRLPRFGLDKEVANALSILEGVLSMECFGYSASARPRDRCIRNCMEGISRQLTQNEARSKFSVLERRSGIFAPSPSQALSVLDRKALTRTHEEILTSSNTRAGDEYSLVTKRDGSEKMEHARYDPIFVLKTFLLACREASKSPERAILDIGKAAKEGLLGLSITGLASDSEEVRLLSYCCIQSFAQVVGPQKGVQKGSAAALYKDRKQLAFLLTLLKNSIDCPTPKVLPLFAVWFRECMRIALLPHHDSYKAVTYFFMRSPIMDVYDCPGVAYLLQCDAKSQLPAVRKLGLQILRHGVRSIGDRNVLRKRRIMDSIFLLSRESSGAEHLRREVLETLVVITSREKDVNMANELLLSHGLLSWLLPDPNSEEELSQLSSRIKLLTIACEAFEGRGDSARFAARFSRALASIVIGSRRHVGNEDSHVLPKQITSCASSICRLAPYQQGLLLFDLAQLQCERVFNLKTDQERIQLATSIARQNRFEVSMKILEFLIESSVLFFDRQSSQQLNAEVLKHPRAVDVCMIHVFLFRAMLYQKQSRSQQKVTRNSFLLLAEAMSTCPTVWLTVASICAVESKDNLSSELTSYTDRLPGYPTKSLDLTQDRRYASAVNSCQSAIIDNLLECTELP